MDNLSYFFYEQSELGKYDPVKFILLYKMKISFFSKKKKTISLGWFH